MKNTSFAKFTQCFRGAIRAEAEAIAKVADTINDEAVLNAIELLTKCCGFIVVSGVGKSGLIGQKIAATLTSTGSPAIFMHAADALHGDFGRVREGDVAILISQSGETEDVAALVPHLRSRHVPILALSGNVKSTIARASDVILSTSVDREACTLNLAPTSSTAVALALGDALALTMMQFRKFTPEEFARNHPCGRLGRQLTLRVRDIMHTGVDNPTVEPNASWAEVIEALCNFGLGAVSVVDKAGALLGIITDGDVRRAVPSILGTHSVAAATMMSSEPVVISPESFALDALRLMENRKSQISVLPVVDSTSGVCVGLIRIHDLFRSGIL